MTTSMPGRSEGERPGLALYRLHAAVHVVGVDDPVGVALLGQEPLAVRGEVRVDRVAGDHRVEAGAPPSALGRSSRPSRCASSCRDPNVPDTWIATAASGRSMEKFATLETTRSSISPSRKASKSRSRSLTLVSPLITGASRCSPSSSSWSMYWPMTSVGSPWCWRTSSSVTSGLGRRWWRRSGSAPPARRSRRRAARSSVSVTRTSTQSAGAIQPCASMSFHGRVVALRADQGEHVALPAVLAHQRRGQPDPPAGLQVGGHPEDRRGQQVHLVVDDQAPVAGVEQLEVAVDALPPGRHHLVRRDGDRPDLLLGAGVLADLVLGQRGTPDQLVLPLARARRCW